jgi:hypothetical protein
MPGAFIRFTDFGDSSNFSIIFGQKNYSELKISSDIRIKIFELFKKKQHYYSLSSESGSLNK